MDEFSLIARYFRPLAGPGGLGLTDDAAVFMPPAGRQLVISADAMVQGVHFLPDDPADLVARKLLRTNLSDLAAMGALPFGYLMTVSTPRDIGEEWFAAFAAGLAQDQAHYSIMLLGGDTTSTSGPVSLSLTILGTVLPGEAILRSGARAGNDIWVSGTIGDGALGLLAASGKLVDATGFLADRYRLPQPRLGLAKAGLVRACMDVSDGLVQDLRHLCRASGMAAIVYADSIPLSQAAKLAMPRQLSRFITGGDDYELIMAVAPEDRTAFETHAQSVGVSVSLIGRLKQDDTPKITLCDRDGMEMEIEDGGWNHFS